MKKLALLLALLLPLPALAADAFYWSIDSNSTTLGAQDHSAGDTTATLNGTASFSTGAKKYGTHGILTVDTNDYYSFTVTAGDLCSETQGTLAGWIQFKTALPSSGQNVLLHCRNSGTSSEAKLSIGGTGGDEARLILTSTGGTSIILATTACNMAINTWYFIVGSYNISNDDRTIACYDTSLALIDSKSDLATDLAAAAPGAFNDMRVGMTGTNVNAIWVDNVFTSVTYGEAFQNFGAITSFVPTYTAAPTLGTATTSTLPFTYTSDQKGTTYAAACTNGQTIATFAALKTGTCSGGAAVGTGTDTNAGGVADTVTITGLAASTTYDVYVGQESDLGGQSTISSQADKATAANPTAVLSFYWSAETTTLSATDDFSADLTSTLNGTASLSATAVKTGVKGILTVDTNDYYSFSVTSGDLCSETQGTIAGWVQWKTALPATGQNIIVTCLNTGNSSQARLSIGGTGGDEARLVLTSSGGTNSTLATTTVNMVVDQWYFIVGSWHIANDDRSIAVYDSSLALVQPATTDLSTDLAASAPGAFDQVRAGQIGTDTSGSWYDNIFISTTYGIAFNTYGAITSFVPAFSAGPTNGTFTETTLPFTYTTDQAGTTYAAACTNGQTITTFANLKTATCSGGAALGSATDTNASGVSDTITITGLTTGQLYDVYIGQESGLGGQSAISSMADRLTGAAVSGVFAFLNRDRAPDTGQAIVVIGSVSATGICDQDSYFTPDCAVDDVFEYDVESTENADCDVLVDTTGDFTLAPVVDGGCDNQQIFGISYQDVSIATDGLFTAPTIGNFAVDDSEFINPTAPECTDEFNLVVLVEDTLADDIDLNAICIDADGDALNWEVDDGTLPTGLTLDDGDIDSLGNAVPETGLISGTPTTEDESGEVLTFSVTDPSGLVEHFFMTIYVINTWSMVNCVTNTASECAEEVVVAAPWRADDVGITIDGMVCDAGTPGLVLTQDPASGAQLAAFAPITLDLSRLCTAASGAKSRLGLGLGVP